MLSLNAQAKNSNIWLDNITTAELEQIYHNNNYDNHIPLPSYIVPKIFLNNLPLDFDNITNDKFRSHLFIKILSPLAILLNDKILIEREKLLSISDTWLKNQKISPSNLLFIEALAKKYDVFTRLKENERTTLLIKELIDKVDIIPPSMLIATAAINTNWGASQISRQGNSLYKSKVWHSSKGTTPRGESKDNTYKLKTYPSLYKSMEEFALKINSNVSYRHTRMLRKETRFREKPITGTALAHSMIFETPLKNFAGVLDYTIAYYELNIIDKSKLKK